MATLQQVLQDVASYVNQDNALVSGTDLTTWSNLTNQAQNEWGDAYQWKQLRFTQKPSTTLSQASLGLPTTFKKLMSPLYDYSTGIDSPAEYKEIRPEERFQKSSTDKYVYSMGNDAQGRYLVVNPALPSGASVQYDWQSFPSSVATLADIFVCPSREYVVKRTIQYILSARSDPRFTLIKSEADDLLANMIEEESALSGGMDNQVKSYYQRNRIRIGEY